MARYVKVGLETGDYGSGAGTATGIKVTAVDDPIDRGAIFEETIDDFVSSAGYGGALVVGGSLTGSLRPIQQMELLEALFGTGTVNGLVTTYTLGQPKSLILDIGEYTGVTNSSLSKLYNGVGLKSATFTFNPKAIVEAKYDWIGKNFTDGAFSAPASYTEEDPIMFYTAAINIGGSVSNMKSLDLTIDRSLDTEQFCLGAFDMQRLTINGMTTLKGTMTFTEQEYTKYINANTGSDTATTIPANNPLGGASSVTITCTDLSSPANTRLVITMPVLVYTNTERSIQGNNEIEKQIGYQAVGSGFTFVVTEPTP